MRGAAKVDLRRILKRDKRHCATCKVLVGYFSGQWNKREWHSINEPKPGCCTRGHTRYYCTEHCPNNTTGPVTS